MYTDDECEEGTVTKRNVAHVETNFVEQEETHAPQGDSLQSRPQDDKRGTETSSAYRRPPLQAMPGTKPCMLVLTTKCG